MGRRVRPLLRSSHLENQSGALAIQQKVLGASHTALSLTWLADVVHTRGKLWDALPLYQRALDIVDTGRYFSPSHPFWILLLDGYAQALAQAGDTKAADELWQRLKNVRNSETGPSAQS